MKPILGAAFTAFGSGMLFAFALMAYATLQDDVCAMAGIFAALLAIGCAGYLYQAAKQL